MRSEEQIKKRIAALEPRRKFMKKLEAYVLCAYFDGWVDALEWVLGEK